MALNSHFGRPRNQYDTDDPENYMDRSDETDRSRPVAWIIGCMLAAAAIVGLITLGGETPNQTSMTQTTQNMPTQPVPTPTQPN